MKFSIGGGHRRRLLAILLAWLAVSDGVLFVVFAAGGGANFDYKDALMKSLLFLEAQRSGKLPKNNRVKWRGDSALQDGQYAHIDLTGGYYDAGDNVKYGLPMAFTITTLAWATLFYKEELSAAGQLQNSIDAIKWGTDYFLKATSKHNRLWVQVGDPEADHKCWIRPENMKTPRTLYKIQENIPGTEIAAETSAAMAASSIVFREIDKGYARNILNKAKWLFDFANKYKGTYDGECPFYCSYSGYQDELLWAGTWLYIATKQAKYHHFLTGEAISNSVAEFNWDLKYAGAQILLTELRFKGAKGLDEFKTHADNFICAVLPDSPFHQVFITKGGMIHLRDGANMQYVTGAAFLLSVYGDVLTKHNQNVECGTQVIKPSRLLEFAKQQIDYLLGKNPLDRSFMVGFGKNPPSQAHHRGASVPVLPKNFQIDCGLTFSKWLDKDGPNVNELTGAIVGGPDKNDYFEDKRKKSSFTEPVTYCNSLAVGPLARLFAHST